MEKANNRKLAASAVLIVASVALLLGLTFAWFTDTVTSKGNKIQAGTLEVQLWSGGADISNATVPVFSYEKWEPGYSTGAGFTVKNAGNLAVKYELTFRASDTGAGKGIENAIEVTVDGAPAGTLAQFLDGAAFASGTLEAGASSAEKQIVLKMREDAGNAYQGAAIEFDILLVATQAASEADGFGSNQYDAAAAFAWDGVSVTEVVPSGEGVYSVATGSDLAWIAQAVADGTLNKTRSGAGVTVVLENDIDLGGNEWTPIGGDQAFTGTFDGNGHTISNLTATKNPSSSDPTRGVALFGYAENATIKNLKIESCNLQGRYSTSAVVGDGCAPLTFENIEVASGVIDSNQNASSTMLGQVSGGILGQGWGPTGSTIVFKNCVNRADVLVNKQHAGGLWGSVTTSGGEKVSEIRVEGCSNYGDITVRESGAGYAGGLGAFASVGSCTVVGCANYGTVTAPQYVSDFVATFNGTPIEGNTA